MVTLALAYDIDALARDGGLRRRPTGRARLPRQQRAVHVDDRVPGAQGQPEGHQGLGRSREAGRRGHHAEPEDLGRRALELPRRVGVRAEASGRRRGQGEGVRRRALQERAVLDSGARGSTTTFVERGHRRRADRLGERGAARGEAELARTSSRSSCRRSASSPSRRSRWSTRWSTSAARARWRRRTSSSSTREEGQGIAAKHYYRPRDPAVARGGQVASRSRRSSSSRSTRCSAAGKRRRRRTSPTAASSTRSTQAGK